MPNFVVKSQVRETLGGNQISADFFDALNEDVAELLDDAARRADANDRTTVLPRDL